MRHTLADIASALGADFFGDGSLVIEGLSEPATAGPRDLALATNESYSDKLAEGNAKAAVLWPGADWRSLGLSAAIVPVRPRFLMAVLTEKLDPGQGFGQGVHPSAIVDPTAEIGADVSIGAFSIVGSGAKLGAGCVIGPQCYVGADVVIGPNAYLREQVSIGARAIIGADFIAQPGARIGSDGFSFVTPEKSNVETARESLGTTVETSEQSWSRIHSLGAVTIGDDVEVGANSCVDSGTLRPTEIGSGTKLDNQVHVGHNVVIGRDCLLCGQVGIAGSVSIGNNVVLGGKVGVSDNVFIGDNVVAGGGSSILSNVPAGRAVLGYPAVKMDSQIESYKALRRLPRLMRDVAALKKAISKSDTSD
ncbi:MAG: UDP-3-O-(3-hydroxymyristoyl)glucosamine N-acyltransferase [Paracoccaceae bacterium]